MVDCNVYSDGSAAAIDTWNPAETKTNVLDKDQVCLCILILKESNFTGECTCREMSVITVHR